MATRIRISPQQLRLIALAAASPWGFCNDSAYKVALGVPAKWDRKEPLPDAGKASVHRSLSKLAKGGFLHRCINAPSHAGKLWKMTIEGKALADRHGFQIAYPDPERCTSPETLRHLEKWHPVYA